MDKTSSGCECIDQREAERSQNRRLIVEMEVLKGLLEEATQLLFVEVATPSRELFTWFKRREWEKAQKDKA
jgi:hypothetical protein